MKKIWKDSNDHLLGTMSDMKLSSKLGVDMFIVLRERTKKGIPSFRSTQKTAEQRHIETLKGYTDDQLRVHQNLFPSYLRRFIGAERKRRGISRWEASKALTVDPVNMRQAMVKAAYTLKPRPSLEAIGKALRISRQRVHQIIDSLVGADGCAS